MLKESGSDEENQEEEEELGDKVGRQSNSISLVTRNDCSKCCDKRKINT